MTIPFALPTTWTTEHTLAVFELFHDLLCPIWSRYQLVGLVPPGRHPDVEEYFNTIIDNPAAARDLANPADWTIKQAHAVFKLLGDLHAEIWTIYYPDPQNLIRKLRQTGKIVALHPGKSPF